MSLRGKRHSVFGAALPESAAVAFVAPLVVAGCLAIAGFVPWPDLLAARTVVLFAALGSLAAAAAGGLASRAGRRCMTVGWMAGALGLGATASVLAKRIHAETDAGLQEEAPPWRIRYGGVAVRLPDLKIAEMPDARTDGRVRLIVDGRELVAGIGSEVAVDGGRRVVVRDLFVAPAFVVERSGGADVGSALVKLEPGRRDWYMVGDLPHRFYVTMPERSGSSLAPPSSVHLRVQRGKLRVHDGDVAVGGEARFEGVRLRYEGGLPWARIELRSIPAAGDAVIPVLLAAATFLVTRRRRAVSGAKHAG